VVIRVQVLVEKSDRTTVKIDKNVAKNDICDLSPPR
jgi:hypothetical protein